MTGLREGVGDRDGGSRPLIEAVIVNHNTSLFAELALRSLVATSGEPGEPYRLAVTVMDNHSADDTGPLVDAVLELGAQFQLSRWPAAGVNLNSHGDVLRDFVLARPEADYFLFIDSDIDFESDRPLAVMLAELAEDPNLWAVQARFSSVERREGEGASLDIGAGRPFRASIGEWVWDETSKVPVSGIGHARCHPGATLIRNSQLFQGVARHVGFSSLVVIAADPEVAGFHDTLGMASAAFAGFGSRYALSAARVHHFFMASYDRVHIEAREVDARNRLARFRAR